MRHRTPAKICFVFLMVVALAIAVSPLVNSGSNREASHTAAANIEDIAQPAQQTYKPPLTAQTKEQDASSTPTPALKANQVSFVESAELRLPGLAENLQYGQPFHLRGTVLSDAPLKSVKVTILGNESPDPIYPFEATVTFSKSDNVMSYSFEEKGITEEDTEAGLIPFDKLQPGFHTLYITASTFELENIPVTTAKFIVDEPSEWMQLISNNFRNNYSSALSFFGQKERFLFKYKWGKGRRIVIAPEWEKEHIGAMPGLNGELWEVHVDAVPYFNQALEYLNNTNIRVTGNGHDSGVIKLSQLVKSYNGAYVSRYVTDKSFVSHHSFGTAIDINAATEPNIDKIENGDIIRDEVMNRLAYNGIEMSDGVKYYSFIYSGEWKEYYQGVPESVLNYLLYELAFYRAGFRWGYYFSHTCDGMHFTLTETDISKHSLKNGGLRKVYDYIGD